MELYAIYLVTRNQYVDWFIVFMIEMFEKQSYDHQMSAWVKFQGMQDASLPHCILCSRKSSPDNSHIIDSYVMALEAPFSEYIHYT